MNDTSPSLILSYRRCGMQEAWLAENALQMSERLLSVG